MKTNKGFRDENHADELRKAKRLEPIHKSGKERHTIYRELDDEEDVVNELEKMEEEHIICGYHTLIDWDKAPVKSASAIIELKVTPKKETGARSCCTVIWSRCSSGTISSPIFTNRYA